MEEDIQLTPVAPPPAAASPTPSPAPPPEGDTGAPPAAGADQQGAEGDKPAKQPKTLEQLEAELAAEQRRNKQLARGLDRRTRALAEERARLGQLTPQQRQDDNRANANEGDTVQLTRAELNQRIEEEARRLAPTLREQAAEVERRNGVVQNLAKHWGQEKFDRIASDLDDAFGGLADRSGAPRPAVEAVFEADNPAQVIEFLADPDNADEAERISRLSAVQAGKAIAKLEATLAAKQAQAKPKPSNAPAPLEEIRGQGSTLAIPDPVKDPKGYRRWANEQERKGN